jgi:hypothetical protein
MELKVFYQAGEAMSTVGGVVCLFYRLFDPFYKFFAVQHHHAPALAAAYLHIRADPHDLPQVVPAGVGFLGPHDIA